MKKLFLSLPLILCAYAADPAVDLTKPIPALRLPDGTVLRQAVFVTFKADRIFVKHAGGSTTLIYEALPLEYRAEAEKRRPGSKYFAGDLSNGAMTYRGQVFVQTQGNGPYKFGNVKVYAFDSNYLAFWQAADRPVQLPIPLAETTTDADGKFTMNLPPDRPFFFFAQAERLRSDGELERFEWRVPGETVKERANVLLSNESLLRGWSSVKIQPAP